MTSLFAALFLSGAGTGFVVLDTLILFLICIVVMLFSVTILRAVTARLRVEQTFKFYWTYPTGLALISLILAWFGL
jgi:formate hydrogenlyase subunit 4